MIKDIVGLTNDPEYVPQESEVDEISYLEYANQVLAICPMKTLEDTKEVLFYEDGYYQKGGDIKVKKILLQLKPDLEIHDCNEIIEKVKQLTWCKRELFDNHDFEICLKNGIVDVKTGEFTTHDPEKLFVTQIPVNYSPDADCPKFKTFLKTCLPNENDYIDQLEAFSSGLIKNNPKLEAMFFETGQGNNGKSTFFTIMNTFYGPDNYATTAIHDLIGNRFAKARLEHKRINTFPDIESDSLENLGILKALVSGDAIDAEYKYQNPHTFSNYAKLFFSANELPPIQDKTHAIFKRIRLTQWTQTFKKDLDYQSEFDLIKNQRNWEDQILDADQIKLIEDELRASGIHRMDKQFVQSIIDDQIEQSGILNLLLSTIKALIERDGFTNEYWISDLKNQWSKGSDGIEAFVTDCLIKDSEAFVVKSEVYRVYYTYCKSIEKIAGTDNQFHPDLKKLDPSFEESQIRIKSKFSSRGEPKRVYKGFKWNYSNGVVKTFEGKLTGVTGVTGKLEKHTLVTGEN